jgi:hypothetical protein
MLQAHANNLPTEASISSLNRWRHRLQPLKPTGNKQEVKIRGQDLFCLIVLRLAHPTQRADQLRRAIFEFHSGNNPRIFSRVDICRAENLLEMNSKAGSTTANQAMSANNIMLSVVFWTSPPPVGIRTVSRVIIFDTDEVGFYITVCII